MFPSLVLRCAGLAALAVGMGIGRFAFTPILPLMQAEGALTLASGGWLAAANYAGYLAGALSAPLKMVRHGGPQASGYHPGWSALHGVMWVGFAALLIWVAYTFIPGVSEVLDQLMWAANLTVTTFTETIV